MCIKNVDFRSSLAPWWSHSRALLLPTQEDHGDCLVPNKYPPCPSLGIWVANQRTWKRLYDAAKAEAEDVASATNDVKEDRIRQLVAIGFDWTPQRASRKRKVESSSDNAPTSKRKKKVKSKKSGETSKKSSKDKSNAAVSAPQEEKSDEGMEAMMAAAGVLEEAQAGEGSGTDKVMEDSRQQQKSDESLVTEKEGIPRVAV